MTTTPYIDLAPKDPLDNLKWRARWREAALGDRDAQAALRQAAFDDVLFFFNAFCWCFEPRSTVKIKPFVTWPHQDPAILAMDQAITDGEASEEPLDVVVNKSRAQGGTWIYLNIFIRRWLRDPMFSAGLVTRNEDLVDSATDADTLLWKVAWMLERLPRWMMPAGFDIKKHRSLSDHSIMNPENGATIVGYAAGQDVGRGGRKTVFAVDEIGAKQFIAGAKDEDVMEALHDVTNCIFQVSTFGGDSGVFFEAATGDNNAVKIVLDWKDNPTQNKLSYIMKDGQATAVDPSEADAVAKYIAENRETLRRLERQGYAVEGKQRSRWYDLRCQRPGATPRLIAKELDRNPRGTVGKVFSIEVLDRMKEECCRPPLWQGKLVYDNETLEVKGLIEQENGPLKLWFRPGFNSLDVPSGSFVIGCDISSGGSGDYSSNSTAEGICKQTGEQVLEYAVMGMMPTKFARLCVTISRWMNNAYLAWEASGPGALFAREVLEVIYYPHCYYRDVENIGEKQKSKKAGWWNGSDEDKGELFEQMCIAFESGDFIPRSEDLIRECGEYEWENGKIIHRPSKTHGTAGKTHGDRCVGGGVAWLGCRDRPVTRMDVNAEMLHNPPYGSFAWRQQQADAAERSFSDDEPQMTLQDLLR